MLVNTVNYVASTIFEMGCMITNVMSHVATENSVTIINDKKTHRCRQVHHATFILQSETESGCAFHQFFFFDFFFASFYQETEFEFKALRQQSINCADCFLRTDQGPIYTKRE